MLPLYDRERRARDRTMRCYLTLKCSMACEYCSARVPLVTPDRKEIYIPASQWAEGLNRRKRNAVLAGGEPFLYPEFVDLILLLDKGLRAEIYTNLVVDLSDFLSRVDRNFAMLVSLHVGVPDWDQWWEGVTALEAKGNRLRFHVVRCGDWEDRVEFLKTKDARITTCADQTRHPKSLPENQVDNVRCRTCTYMYGPDGLRYQCVTKLGLGEDPVASLECDPDDIDWHENFCSHFGNCAGCDGLLEGTTVKTDDPI